MTGPCLVCGGLGGPSGADAEHGYEGPCCCGPRVLIVDLSSIPLCAEEIGGVGWEPSSGWAPEPAPMTAPVEELRVWLRGWAADPNSGCTVQTTHDVREVLATVTRLLRCLEELDAWEAAHPMLPGLPSGSPDPDFDQFGPVPTV